MPGQAPLLTAARVDEIISKFDTNGDGVLSLDEFARALAGVAEEANATLEELMAIADTPAGETFADLVPSGAGCEIAKMNASRYGNPLAKEETVWGPLWRGVWVPSAGGG